MPDTVSQVTRHRERAEECRSLAKSLCGRSSPGQTYTSLEKYYEALAGYEESLARDLADMQRSYASFPGIN